MKKLFLLTLSLYHSSLLFAQESSESIIAYDPTQLYTNVDLSGCINFTTLYGGIEPDNWVVNLRGDFAINKFNFGFDIPFTNIGNYYNFLGDIDLHLAFQPFNRQGVLKSSLIKLGSTLSTTYSENDPISIRYSDHTYNSLFWTYTASVNLTKTLSIYPGFGIKRYTTIDKPTHYFHEVDSFYYPPTFTQLAYTFNLSASYSFNPKSFVMIQAYYETGSWKIKEGGNFWKGGPSEIRRSMFLMNLRYQYSLRENLQLYTRLNYDFGERFHHPELYGWEYDKPGFAIGIQYYLE